MRSDGSDSLARSAPGGGDETSIIVATTSATRAVGAGSFG